jgi:hypothetical protein
MASINSKTLSFGAGPVEHAAKIETRIMMIFFMEK